MFALLLAAEAFSAISASTLFTRHSDIPYAYAAETEPDQCDATENTVVAQIVAEIGSVRELYAAADRAKTQVQRQYSVEKIQALIASGDSDSARRMLDEREALLKRAQVEVDRAAETDARVREQFASLSLGCRRATIASLAP